MSGGLCLTLIFVASLGMRLVPLIPRFVIRRRRCVRLFRRELKRGGVPRRVARALAGKYRDEMTMGEILKWAETLRRDWRE